MKKIHQTIAIIGLTICIPIYTFSKSIPLPVDSIMANITSISQIKIIGYPGDTIMTYVDIEKQDTMELNCKWKFYSESSIKMMKDKNPSYNSLEGSFPMIGDTIILLQYAYYGNGILFARKEAKDYRFWDPSSIPFANSVFIISNKGFYKTTQHCKGINPAETSIYCSDGFLINEKDFEFMLKWRY